MLSFVFVFIWNKHTGLRARAVVTVASLAFSIFLLYIYNIHCLSYCRQQAGAYAPLLFVYFFSHHRNKKKKPKQESKQLQNSA